MRLGKGSSIASQRTRPNDEYKSIAVQIDRDTASHHYVPMRSSPCAVYQYDMTFIAHSA